MNSASVVLMLIAGAGIAAQIAINAHLRTVSGSALWAANIMFTVSLLAGLLALAAARRFSRRSAESRALARALVGVDGRTVEARPTCCSRSSWPAGSARARCRPPESSVSSGRPCLIDHYGWFGMPVQRATPARLIGVGAACGRGRADSVEVKSDEWRSRLPNARCSRIFATPS